jgi:hypothetical protein
MSAIFCRDLSFFGLGIFLYDVTSIEIGKCSSRHMQRAHSGQVAGRSKFCRARIEVPRDSICRHHYSFNASICYNNTKTRGLVKNYGNGNSKIILHCYPIPLIKGFLDVCNRRMMMHPAKRIRNESQLFQEVGTAACQDRGPGNGDFKRSR